MADNPLNLLLRFGLEMAALLVMGVWSWNQGDGIWRVVLALSIPLAAAAIWGIFRVPNDPGSAPVPIPGWVRLLLELAFFGFSLWAAYDLDRHVWFRILAVLLVVHHALSYDRILRLLGSTQEVDSLQP